MFHGGKSFLEFFMVALSQLVSLQKHGHFHSSVFDPPQRCSHRSTGLAVLNKYDNSDES